MEKIAGDIHIGRITYGAHIYDHHLLEPSFAITTYSDPCKDNLVVAITVYGNEKCVSKPPFNFLRLAQTKSLEDLDLLIAPKCLLRSVSLAQFTLSFKFEKVYPPEHLHTKVTLESLFGHQKNFATFTSVDVDPVLAPNLQSDKDEEPAMLP